MTSFAVVGAGAIGGYLGALLAAAGDDVTFIARGPNLEAIRAHGMSVTLEDGREVTARGARATASFAEAGPHDVVLLTVKAHQVTAIASELPRLFHERTSLVPMQNGIPWWYFQRHGGEHEGRPVLAADPGGTIAKLIDPSRIIGCVVYPAATLAAPGVVRVIEGRRVTLGESNASPAATSRTARTRSAGCVCFTRKPLAPARKASNTYSSSSNVVRTRTFVSSRSGSAAIARSASKPSVLGMRTSISTTSGRSARTRRTASSRNQSAVAMSVWRITRSRFARPRWV